MSLSRGLQSAAAVIFVGVLAGICGCALQEQGLEVAPLPTRPSIAAESLEWLRRGLAAQGDLRDEEDCYSQAVQSDPTNGEAYNNLGVVYLEQEDYYRAAHHFSVASRLLSEAPEPAYNLGLLYERVGKPAQAAGYYERAVRLAPGNLTYKGCLARALIRSGGDRAQIRGLLEGCFELEVRPEWVRWIKAELEKLDGGGGGPY